MRHSMGMGPGELLSCLVGGIQRAPEGATDHEPAVGDIDDGVVGHVMEALGAQPPVPGYGTAVHPRGGTYGSSPMHGSPRIPT